MCSCSILSYALELVASIMKDTNSRSTEYFRRCLLLMITFNGSNMKPDLQLIAKHLLTILDAAAVEKLRRYKL